MKTIRPLLRGCLIGCVAAGLLAGCKPNTQAKVRIESGPPLAWGQTPGSRIKRSTSGEYRVNPGDTLFAIAMVHQLEVEELARWNGIKDPDQLFVGQNVRLASGEGSGGAVRRPRVEEMEIGPDVPTSPPRQVVASEASPPRQVVVAPPPQESVTPTVAQVPADKVEKPEAQKPSPPPAKQVVQSAQSEEPPPPEKAEPPMTSREKEKFQAQSAAVKESPAPKKWVWPVRGRLVGRFGDKGGKKNVGIDVEASRGTPVVAAADGIVAYADSGVKGYGNLIILRHGGAFMSAYAHNEVLLVKRGQAIRAGEKIAEVGQTGGQTSPRLHFELRKGVQPLNPLQYLPKG